MSAGDVDEVPFETTVWRAIDDAKTDPDELRRLVDGYYPALRHYLHCRFRGADGHHVDDALHDFLIATGWLLELVHRADRAKGKFRWYLATSARRFVASALGRAGGGELPLGDDDPADDRPDAAFDSSWAETAWRQAVEELHRRCAADRSKWLVWNVFRARYLEPAGEPGWALAGRFGNTKGQVDAAARDGRTLFRELVVAPLLPAHAGPEVRAEAARELFEVMLAHDRVGGWRATELPYLMDSPDTVTVGDTTHRGPPTVHLRALVTTATADDVLDRFDRAFAAEHRTSLEAALTAPHPNLYELQLAHGWAKRYRRSSRPADGPGGFEAAVAGEVATWVYYVAIWLARDEHRVRLSSLSEPALTAGLGWVLARDWGWPPTRARLRLARPTE